MATIKIILLNRFTKSLLDYSRSNVLLKSIGIALFRGHISIGTIGLRVIFPVYLTKPWVGLKSSSLKGGRWGGGGSLKGNGTYLTRCKKTKRVRAISRRDLVGNLFYVMTASTLNLSTQLEQNKTEEAQTNSKTIAGH